MRDHPPDRRLDPPEPTDEELRRDKLQQQFEEQQASADPVNEAYARQEEARREEFTRFMRKQVRPTFVDAYDEQTADRWMDRIWEEVRR